MAAPTRSETMRQNSSRLNNKDTDAAKETSNGKHKTSNRTRCQTNTLQSISSMNRDRFFKKHLLAFRLHYLLAFRLHCQMLNILIPLSCIISILKCFVWSQHILFYSPTWSRKRIRNRLTAICSGLEPEFIRLSRSVFGSSCVRSIPKSSISSGEKMPGAG